MVFAELIQVIELEPLFTGAPMRLWNCDVLPRRTPTPSYTKGWEMLIVPVSIPMLPVASLANRQG